MFQAVFYFENGSKSGKTILDFDYLKELNFFYYNIDKPITDGDYAHYNDLEENSIEKIEIFSGSSLIFSIEYEKSIESYVTITKRTYCE